MIQGSAAPFLSGLPERHEVQGIQAEIFFSRNLERETAVIPLMFHEQHLLATQMKRHESKTR